MDHPRFRAISAVTLATHDMGGAVRFYRGLGFELTSGGETASFTSFRLGGAAVMAPRAAPDMREMA